MQIKKYLCFVNIIIPILLRITIPNSRFGIAATFANMLLPVLLSIYNAIIVSYKIEVSILKCFLIMALGLACSDILGYYLWITASSSTTETTKSLPLLLKSLLYYHIGFAVIAFIFYQGINALLRSFKKWS